MVQARFQGFLACTDNAYTNNTNFVHGAVCRPWCVRRLFKNLASFRVVQIGSDTSHHGTIDTRIAGGCTTVSLTTPYLNIARFSAWLVGQFGTRI